MRKYQMTKQMNNIRIIAIDDDQNMTFSLQGYFQTLGYFVDIENDPLIGIEKIKNNNYDILILDYIMFPINGNEVVSRIREFNSELFIILLTGHKDMVPPLQTIRELDIQGYYEKSDSYDNLVMLVESCVKSIKLLQTIKKYQVSLKESNDKLLEINKQLKIQKKQITEVLHLVVDAKDEYTSGHSDRVSKIAGAIAMTIGMSEEEVEKISLVGLLHDIGKINIPNDILLSSNILNSEEYEEVKKHTIYGRDLLKKLDFLKDVLPAIYHHHERYDGYGYPDGLSGNDIPYVARLICIADSFDAMTSLRRYQKNMSFDDAVMEVISNKGKQFDPKLVDYFIDSLPLIKEILNK